MVNLPPPDGGLATRFPRDSRIEQYPCHLVVENSIGSRKTGNYRQWVRSQAGLKTSAASNADTGAPGPSRPGAFAYLVAAAFFHFASLYYLLSTLPLYVQGLGGSTSEVGLIIGILALTSLAARPVVGPWIDRAGRRRFLVVGAAIYAVASLGYGVIHSVGGLLLWRVLHGMGLATFSTAAASLAADLAPSGRRGSTMGVFGLAQAAALAVGPGAGRMILGSFGYRGVFVASAITALLALACATALPREWQPGRRLPREVGAGSRALWHLIALPAALQFSASVAYGTIISFIAVAARDRGLQVVGPFFALLAFSSLGVRLVAGRAYDRWGAATAVFPMFLVLTTGMALLAIATGPLLFLSAAILAGLGIGGTHTILISSVVDRAPSDRRASGVAGFAACWELGVGGGTVLMGHLADAWGFETMFLAAAALPILGLAALSYLGRKTPAGLSTVGSD
jgi:MFS family permease